MPGGSAFCFVSGWHTIVQVQRAGCSAFLQSEEAQKTVETGVGYAE
jgi:hypothetical protein